MNDLVDVDGDAAVRLLGEALGLYLARDRLELARPIGRHCVAPDDAAALPSVGPVDVGMHQLDGGLEVAGVKAR